MKYELFWGVMAVIVFGWALHTSRVNSELASLQTMCYPILEQSKNAQ